MSESCASLESWVTGTGGRAETERTYLERALEMVKEIDGEGVGDDEDDESVFDRWSEEVITEH